MINKMYDKSSCQRSIGQTVRDLRSRCSESPIAACTTCVYVQTMLKFYYVHLQTCFNFREIVPSVARPLIWPPFWNTRQNKYRSTDQWPYTRKQLPTGRAFWPDKIIRLGDRDRSALAACILRRTWQLSGELNSRPLDYQSDALTTKPPSKTWQLSTESHWKSLITVHHKVTTLQTEKNPDLSQRNCGQYIEQMHVY